jgi:diphthine-ammonia ligase
MMRVAVLFSGGKDSMLVLKVALDQGWEVKHLVTIFSENPHSWMFHRPCIELTKMQAESIGINHIIKKTGGEKEKELKDLVSALESIKEDVDAVVSGAVASRYQKDRIDAICKEVGLQSIAPLWGKDQIQILNQQLEAGFETIFTSVAAEGLDKNWLCRKIDKGTIKELEELSKRYGINPVGEGGEYESLVVNCPLFKKGLELGEVERVWDESTGSGYIICKNAKLI